MFIRCKNRILSLSIALLFLVSCSRQDGNENQSISPKVIDSIHLLSPEVKEYIEETYTFPDGIFVLVRTMDKLDYGEIGSYATDAMEREQFWEQVRPKGFFAKWIKQDKPWSRGVYVLISKDPSLIQIRYGERIRLEAYRSGLAIGKEYLQIQRYFERHGPTLGTLNALRVLSQELPSALTLPWYLQWGKWLVCLEFSEFEELLSPSDDMYTNWLLGPYLKFIERLGGFSSISYFLFLNFVLYFSVRTVLPNIANMFVAVMLRNREPVTRALWKPDLVCHDCIFRDSFSWWCNAAQ